MTRNRMSICKGYAHYGFDKRDMTLLRDQLNAWKRRHHRGRGKLTSNPLFAAALRSLMLDHGYGQSDVSVMLGVSRERVRQWANSLGIKRSYSGSELRVWDEGAGRFVNVGMIKDYRKRLKALKPKKRSRAERCRAIARWVLRDLAVDLGRTPGHCDLADALRLEPGVLNSWLGHTHQLGSITSQNRELWESASLRYPNYAVGARGRPDRQHAPCRGNPLPATTRQQRLLIAREALERLTAELGRQPRMVELRHAMGRPGNVLSTWLVGRFLAWPQVVDLIYRETATPAASPTSPATVP